MPPQDLQTAGHAGDDDVETTHHRQQQQQQQQHDDNHNGNDDNNNSHSPLKSSLKLHHQRRRSLCPFSSMRSSTRSSISSVTSQNTTATNNPASCPLFTGAARRNSSLISKESLLFLQHQYNFVDDDDADYSTYNKDDYDDYDNEVRPHHHTTLLTSPKRIHEDDLFHNDATQGHFSREYAFLMPNYHAAVQALEETKGRAWLELGRRMSGLLSNNALREACEDDLEIIHAADETNCPTISLQIACSVLAHLHNGYRAECWRNHIVDYEAPPSLQIPWTQICQRLGRKDTYFAVEDVMNNCSPSRQVPEGGRTLNYTVDQTEMLSPLWKSSAELVISKLFCAANYYYAQMLPAVLALARNEWKAQHIFTIFQGLNNLQTMMGKAIPDGSAGQNSIDPVEFATAFANSTAPTKDGAPAFSGGGVPVFICLDYMIGRPTWNSFMGQDNLVQIEFMPPNWQRFIHYLQQQKIYQHVPDNLQYLWAQMKDAYIGDRGWLGRHKYRAYQFVELSGVLGRASNKGSSTGAAALEMLEEARHERDPNYSSDRSSYKTCLFKGCIEKVVRISEDRLTQLVTITTTKPIFVNLGDHVAIVMKNSDDRIWRFAVQHDLPLKRKLSVGDSLTEAWKERLDFDHLDHTVYNVLLCAKLTKACAEKLTVNNMCRLLCPEEPRLYSFATINPGVNTEGFTSIDLLVTKTGEGGCSAFLFDSVGQELSFGLSSAFKHDLPASKPVVVIAAGSGVGTYLPLLVNDEIINPRYAFLAFRTEQTVPYLESHLKKAVAYNKLQLYIELSREAQTLVTHKRRLVATVTKKRYIDSMLREQAALLRKLARPVDEGGMQASFYVCGNSAFFVTISQAMEEIEPGMVSSLVEENRLFLEVQARGGIDGNEKAQPISLSQMCFHNTMTDFWTAIHGKVYDLSSYVSWHPGGRKILHYVAGTDCTEQWDLVSHGRDRMVYSQLLAYEVGPYVSDCSAMEKFLELITRCENCVNLYRADNLFNNLCDSYGKVQNVLERVFGEDFLRLCLQLEPRVCQNILHRIWFVIHGRERLISNRMFLVAPIIESKEQKGFVNGDQELLRHAGSDERDGLKSRLLKASDHFFTLCKTAVAEFVSSAPGKPDVKNASRIFFRLVLGFEEFYSSLAQPLPVSSVRKWDVVRSEFKLRRTFFLRFPRNPKKLDDNFQYLTNMAMTNTPEENQSEHYIEALLEAIAQEPMMTRLVDQGRATNLVNEWLFHEDEMDLFHRMDEDQDGLVSREDLAKHLLNHALKAQDEAFLHGFMKTDMFANQETFNFSEFLEGDPKVSQHRKMFKVSSIMRKTKSRHTLEV